MAKAKAEDLITLTKDVYDAKLEEVKNVIRPLPFVDAQVVLGGAFFESIVMRAQFYRCRDLAKIKGEISSMFDLYIKAHPIPDEPSKH